MSNARILPLAVLAALALPGAVQAGTAPVSDELCFALMADPAANIDDPDAQMLASMMVGYYAGKVRERIGPKGDLNAALERGVEQFSKLSNAQAKEARNACIDQGAEVDMAYPFTVVLRMREGE